jgi:hypothetical protein
MFERQCPLENEYGDPSLRFLKRLIVIFEWTKRVLLILYCEPVFDGLK